MIFLYLYPLLDTKASAAGVGAGFTHQAHQVTKLSYLSPPKEKKTLLLPCEMSMSETNNNRILPFGRNDIVICFHLNQNRLFNSIHYER